MIERIFAYHAMKYPLMQPQDAVKLLYQHSFGVGHLIPDSRAFLERLIRETEERCSAEVPVFVEAAPGHFVACHKVTGGA